MKAQIGNLVTILVVAALIADVRAQRLDSIDLYANPSFNSTTANDGLGTLTVYVVHDPHAAQVATVSASFKISPSPGFTGVWLNDSTPLLTHFGTSPDGVDIVYNGGCAVVTSKTLVLTATYTVFGTSANCSFLEVTPHPLYGIIYVQDCDFSSISADGGRLTINPDQTCSPLPVESVTWGRIKALYR